jgi:RNA polymerase sigma-54 factor
VRAADTPDFLLFESAPAPTLEDDLKQELELSILPDGVKKEICEYLIEQLDEEGFLRIPTADVAMNCNSDIEDVDRALEFLQSFDPPGVGARTLQECWLLQLKRRGELTPEFETLLTGLTDEISRNRPDLIAARLHISMAEVETMYNKIKRLNRAPVQSENIQQTIVPDVEIIKNDNGTFYASSTKEKRSFKLSEYASWENAPDAGKDFVEKIKEAKNLLEALEFRKSTIMRIAEMLIDTQHEFLEYGPEKLKPFTMKQAAEYLDFKNESTVSRAVAEKYVKTPVGIFPLKYFFSAGYVSNNGEEVSRRADMEKLKELIEMEDKRHPLSDEKLSQLLNEAGHPVARRTVVKYRELMKIPNSSLRKEHF